MPKRPPDDEALERLNERLDALQTRTTRKRGALVDKAAGPAYRLMAELVSGVLGGLGLGWLVDHYVGTAPWGVLIGVIAGAGAGVFLVVKTASRMSAQATEQAPPAKPVPFDDDEDA